MNKEQQDKIIRSTSKRVIKIMREVNLPVEKKVALTSLCLGTANSITEVMRALEVPISEIDTMLRLIKIYAQGVEDVMNLGVDVNVDNDTSEKPLN